MKQKIPEDPELKRQQAAAAQQKVNTIQDQLSAETDKSMRYFGARQAMAGARSSPLLKILK
ncbi:hypothetical protein [Gellertiella hungarica]|uniref:Uncharacterized protein n=1 Tax=Gellertiella hungarica TaxID=1572859 RepID=A0A7W6NMS7_9HYPH|nr:hypothetical protein [Gellertiella hungarica]MBB4066760.1 hypothetical protein [Gellertiella hungarica]